jgi:THO complex subunit 4
LSTATATQHCPLLFKSLNSIKQTISLHPLSSLFSFDACHFYRVLSETPKRSTGSCLIKFHSPRSIYLTADSTPHLHLFQTLSHQHLLVEMASKLNQSLGEIITEGRRDRNKRKGPRTSSAPVGGIAKTRPGRNVSQAGKPQRGTPTGPANRESKILVSNLPTDVDEPMIKEYFAKTAGAIKRVVLTYGPNGQSRGIATIIFARADGASNAAKKCEGLSVDGRKLRVEVVIDAANAPVAEPVKPLNERVTQTKAQPKPANADKPRGAATRGRGAKRGRGGKARSNRPKATQETLDAEMDVYMGYDNQPAGEAGATTGQTAAGGDDTDMGVVS